MEQYRRRFPYLGRAGFGVGSWERIAGRTCSAAHRTPDGAATHAHAAHAYFHVAADGRRGAIACARDPAGEHASAASGVFGDGAAQLTRHAQQGGCIDGCHGQYAQRD
jgi:hypothetical protein